MVDYTKSTGNAGTMMIRDDGTYIEFWLRSSDSSTYNTALPWSGSINGQNPSGTVSYGPNSPWVRVLRWSVSSSQTVRFSIGNTNTWGFGGPTDFTKYISRSSKPGKTTNVRFENIGHTSVRVRWDRGSMNGGSFEQDQIQISSTSQSGSGDFTNGRTESDYSGEVIDISGLSSLGQTYWVHVRTKNNLGWGPWSDIKTFKTLASAKVKVNGVWKDAIAYVKVNGVWVQAIPYVRVSGVWEPCG